MNGLTKDAPIGWKKITPTTKLYKTARFIKYKPHGKCVIRFDDEAGTETVLLKDIFPKPDEDSDD